MSKVYFYYAGEKIGMEEKVIAVEVGSKGFYPIKSALSASALNEIAEIPEEVAESAVAGSMFGWGVPAAKLAVEFAKARESKLS